MRTPARARTAPPMTLRARTAADLMTAGPVSIRQAATVREAAAFLSARGISAAPVIDEAGRPVGVVSRTDLLHRRAQASLCLLGAPGAGFGTDAEGDRPGTPRVRDVMTPAVFCVRAGTAAAKVVEKMIALRVRRLFVVDGDGVLVGVISAFDVLRDLRPQGARAGG